ncbi:ribonuclease HII [Halogeometricum pallidum JCM 14848]|uniref:Ribonuclease HII n=1 Tax=Halogeometricum pallidum JCM 14848 TaxID=1227487 RepID=M0DFX4_HALPD|nr:ribonuclease HII [Halogeometricum pallidum]ELZ33622.1 ribonuclease HII [Halogeometricum pallidum JCM 14848]
MTDGSPVLVGSDEAGKGPVLGPMVAAAVRADADALPDGIDDSKRLSSARREEIAATLREHEGVEIGVAFVEPERIDRPDTDMNALTVAAHVEAVAAVAREGDEVVTDAGDVNESRFGRRVRTGVEEAGVAVSVTAEHRADETYPHVGAASVVAKVERDARMAEIDEDVTAYGPVGSGYPSDPTTREFLRRYVGETGELPDCARASWSTCDDVLDAAAQSSLTEF